MASKSNRRPFRVVRLLQALTAALLFGSMTFLTEASAEKLFVYRGRGGSLTFSNRAPKGGQDFKLINPLKVSYTRVYRFKRRALRALISEYDAIIKEVAEEAKLDITLMKAVIHVESGFNEYATSHKGAMGLMQLMPGTARRFGVRNAYRAKENLGGGAKYLRMLLDRYSGNVKLALAAYNAGEGAVDRFRMIPPYPETQNYVVRVLEAQEAYRCVDEGRKNC